MNRYERLLDEARRIIERGEAGAWKKRALIEKLVAAARATPKRPPRRKPPEAGIPVPAIPPKGPLPKQGGAEAPLEFE